MLLREPADSGEDACPQPCQTSLRAVANGVHFEKFSDARKKYIGHAQIVRKLSDNFVPEIFEARQRERVPCSADSMKDMLAVNEKALSRLKSVFDSARESGTVGPRRIALYEARYERERKRLDGAKTFFAAWYKTHHPQICNDDRAGSTAPVSHVTRNL